MSGSGIASKILTVSIVSAAIAFSPALLFQLGSQADTTGTGGLCATFPLLNTSWSGGVYNRHHFRS